MHIEVVLRLLMAAEMKLKLNKCYFVSISLDCMRHMIAPGKLQFAETKTKVIESLRYIKDIFQMWSFQKLCNVYRCLVSGFAKIDASLKRKVKKGEPSKLVSNDQ